VTALLVAAGAAAGAPLRYLTDLWLRARFGPAFPYGTLLVNVAGSFVLGLTVGLTVSTPTFALLGTGFCGALTTYSTFGLDTIRLLATRATRRAVLNVVANTAASLATATVGLVTGALLT
jgi:fluoride exporter